MAATASGCRLKPTIGGIVWAMENPRRGIVEPDELDHARIMEIARPYLGTVVGV